VIGATRPAQGEWGDGPEFAQGDLTEPRLTEPRLTEPRLTEPRLTGRAGEG
jgi:hypothetical protein